MHWVRHCSPCWTKPDQSVVGNDGHCGSLKPTDERRVAIDTYPLTCRGKHHKNARACHENTRLQRSKAVVLGHSEPPNASGPSGEKLPCAK